MSLETVRVNTDGCITRCLVTVKLSLRFCAAICCCVWIVYNVGVGSNQFGSQVLSIHMRSSSWTPLQVVCLWVFSLPIWTGGGENVGGVCQWPRAAGRFVVLLPQTCSGSGHLEWARWSLGTIQQPVNLQSGSKLWRFLRRPFYRGVYETGRYDVRDF